MRRALLALALLSAPASAHGQPMVRVHAETRIELRVERTLDGAILHGTLRDDRGDPLPDRPVGIRVFAAGSRTVTARAEERTDTQGHVSAAFTLELTEHRVEAEYSGDDRYHGVRVEQMLDLGRVHVRLGMSIDGEGRLDLLDLDRPTHSLRVRAESQLGGEGLQVELQNELEQQLASGITDSEGVVRFEVSSEALGPPAAGRLVVKTRGDAERAAAQTEVLVVRFRQTTLRLDVEPRTVRASGRVRIEGELSTSEGPVARAAVGVFADEQHLLTVLTDDRGRFRRDVALEPPTDSDASVALQARFASDAPWRPAASSEPVPVRVETRGAVPWQWLVLSIAVCLVLVVLLSRRSKRPGEDADADPVEPPPVTGILASAPRGRSPSRSDVGGVIFDADERRPVPGARVELRFSETTVTAEADARGEFLLEDLPTGAATMTVSARGYQPSETAVQVPHRGEWSAVKVGLRSLRQIVLARFAPLANALRPSRRWWAFWTARELAGRAGGAVREEVSDVTADVERAAYAGPPPEAEQVDAIGQRARRLADQLDDPG